MIKKTDLTEDTTTKMTKGLFSSRTEEWATPQYVFDWLASQFNFTLDVCATRENAKCKKFYSKTEDGLKQKWYLDSGGGDVFMNPPYGKEIYKWMYKAMKEGELVTVVCLVHARTDTKWFHETVVNADEVWFVKGRLKFGDGKQSAPFPSCVVIFRPIEKKINKYIFPLAKSIRIGSKHLESLRELKDFAGGSQFSNENLPQNAETYPLFKE